MKNLAPITNDKDVITKKYAEQNFVPLSGGTVTGTLKAPTPASSVTEETVVVTIKWVNDKIEEALNARAFWN